MRAIDSAMEVLAELAENNDVLPDSWLEPLSDYEDNGWNLTKIDTALVAQVLMRSAPCKFLEIGTGASTGRLYGLNPNGLNVSLEDNAEWIEKVAAGLPPGSGTLLHYSHHPVQSRHTLPQRTDWKAQIKKLAGYTEDQLKLNDLRLLQKRLVIPDWLWSITFDVILVDGPIGGNRAAPGRSGTTLLASRLAGPTSVIFVDDAPNRAHEMRSVEHFFADRYLHVSPSGRMVMAV